MAKDIQQLSFIKKPVIYHYSLNHVYEQCPNCGTINRATERKYNRDVESWYTVYYDQCPVCGQLFDWDEDALESVAKYTKEYKQAMRDCPNGGAVSLQPNGHYIVIT